MESEVSLPCSQEPIIGSYLEPDESSPNLPNSTNSMRRSPIWGTNSHSAIQEILQPFMEPEISLRCLQEPATGSYPEPDESSPHLPSSTNSMGQSPTWGTDGHL